MSLCSSTLPDGSRKIVVDYPYYKSKRSAKYYQTQSREEANLSARRFASWNKNKGLKISIVDHEIKQSVHVTIIEPSSPIRKHQT